MSTTTDRFRRFPRTWPVALLLLLIATGAVAQDEILVNSADPDMGEQGTYDLVVMVGGDNFPSDPKVDFFVTGTCDFNDPNCTGDPGGITVKKAKRQGPKNLKVTLDVAEGAQTEFKFDIRVRSLRGGRSGKGTELFAVQKKSNGPDTTPPGAPTDLQVLEEKFASVAIAWTMPADDGYDVGSGPVWSCRVDDIYPNREPGLNLTNCQDAWVGPNQQQTCLEYRLEPDMDYLLAVKCRDEAGNWSSEAQVVATTRPFSEFQDSSWTIVEVPVPIDALVGHQIDPDGKVLIAGIVGLWEQERKGPVWGRSTVIRIITGVWDAGVDQWTWSFEDVPGYANRFQLDPQGRPAVVSEELVDSKGRHYRYQLVYTSHNGTGWEREIVADFTLDAPASGVPGLAFGPLEEPAVAWCALDEPAGIRLARRDPAGQWSVEMVSSPGCDGGLFDRSTQSAELIFDASGEPVIGWVDRANAGEVRISRWTPEGWSEEVVATRLPDDPWGLTTPDLLYDPVTGGLKAVFWSDQKAMYCDRDSETGWHCDIALPYGSSIPDGGSGETGMSVGPALMDSVCFLADSLGEVFLGHQSEAYFDNALARRPAGVPPDPPGSGWTVEYVDFGQPQNQDCIAGPLVALDPGDQPTLTWAWCLDGRAGEPPIGFHHYFAWKASP